MTRQSRVETHDRHLLAVRMRREGRTLEEIAAACGWRSPASAHKAIRAALRRVESTAVAELRALEDERLDAALARVNDELDAIDVGADPAAVAHLASTLVRITTARVRLHGLDRPDVVIPNPEAERSLEDMKRRISQAFEDARELRRLKAGAVDADDRPAPHVPPEPPLVAAEPLSPPPPPPVPVASPAPSTAAPAVSPAPAATPPALEPATQRTRCARCGSPLTITTEEPTTCAGCLRSSW